MRQNIEYFKAGINKIINYNDINLHEKGVRINNFVKKEINNLDILEFKNFLCSDNSADKKMFLFLSDLPCSTISEHIWNYMEKNYIKEEVLFIYKKNILINSISKNNIYVMKKMLELDPMIFLGVCENNKRDVLSSFIIKDIDLNFLIEKNNIINGMDSRYKDELAKNIIDWSNMLEDKESKKIKYIELLLNIDVWYKQSNEYLLKLTDRICNIPYQKDINKINSLLSNHINDNILEYLKQKNINLLEIFFNKKFIPNPKLMKILLKNQQPDLKNLNKETFPLISKNPENLFNNALLKNFEIIKNNYGMSNIIGNEEEQKKLLNKIIYSDEHLFKRYHTIFNNDKKGTPSPFVELLDLISKEDIIPELKEFAKIITKVKDKNFMENAKIDELYNLFKDMDKELAYSIMRSNPVQIVLINMNNKLHDLIEPHYTILKEKEELLAEINNKETKNIKRQRI